MTSNRISEDALLVLANMTVDGNLAKINDGTLDRKLYQNVNKVLEAIGGKWNRKLGGHVFEEDPADALERAVLTGTYSNVKADFGFFQTPPGLAKSLVLEADVRNEHRVLEPSAGRGRIAWQIGLQAPDCVLFVVEIQQTHVNALRDGCSRRSSVFCDDFLNRQVTDIDRVIMNPPFARKADIDHVLHAYSMLRPGGKLVSVMSAGTKYRCDKKTTEFRTLVADVGNWRDLPEDSFKESGTNVRAVVVTMEKK